MRLIYYPLNFVMELERGRTASLVLEDPALFERFLIDFFQKLGKQNEAFAFYEGEKEKELVKYADLLTSPFDLTYNKREIQKKLFAELEGLAFEQDLTKDLSEANGQIVSVLEQLRFSGIYDIEYKEDFGVLDFFRDYDVHLRDPEGSFAGKLIDYIKTLRMLLGKELFVLANCDAYLTEEDYSHLEQCAAHYEVILLFLRNRQMGLRKGIREYIIDSDLCEIH